MKPEQGTSAVVDPDHAESGVDEVETGSRRSFVLGSVGMATLAAGSLLTAAAKEASAAEASAAGGPMFA